MKRPAVRFSVAAAAALAVTLSAACDDDATGPAGYAWAGTYAAAIGCTANFGSPDPARVWLFADRSWLS
jgi:hypothetical protein